LLTTFEALYAYAASRGTAVSKLQDIVRLCRYIVGRDIVRMRNINTYDRRVIKLLWHLGIVAIYVRHIDRKTAFYVKPTVMAHYIAKGNLTPILLRIAEWKPMKILVKYIAAKGGYTTSSEVEKDLGNTMFNITEKLLPILKFTYKLNRPVKKPFNRHIIEAVLFKLGKELGLLRGEKHQEAYLTEIGYELIRHDQIELIKTIPKVPLVFMVAASVIHDSNKVVIVSPWIDVKVFEALEPILSNKEITIICRPPEKKRQQVLRILENYGEVLIYPKLHTKMLAGESAIITSANLTKASLLYNIETGVYYHQTPPSLRAHIEEIKASAETVST